MYVAPCADGAVQLIGDSRYSEFGRIEVCLNETWGTICDTHWDFTDASVLCKELGFSDHGILSNSNGMKIFLFFYAQVQLPHLINTMRLISHTIFTTLPALEMKPLF